MYIYIFTCFILCSFWPLSPTNRTSELLLANFWLQKNEMDKMEIHLAKQPGSQWLLCLHLYRDLSLPQHISICCTQLEDHALGWKSATNGQYFLCWSLNVKVAYRPYYLFAAVNTHPDTISFLWLPVCMLYMCSKKETTHFNFFLKCCWITINEVFLIFGHIMNSTSNFLLLNDYEH